MRKILDEYRFVKITNEFILDADKKHDVQFKAKGYSSTHPSMQTLKERFRKKYKRKSITEVNRICKNCVKDGYLEGVNLKSGNFEADGVCMTDKGEDLLDTVPYLPFIKIGFIEALWEKHGKIVVALVSFIIGLIPTIVWTINRIIGI